jgi:MFS family permease
MLTRLSKPFAAILMANFTGTLGYSIVMPFLVFIVHDWGGNALIYGITAATYSAFQLVGSPVLGRWSDTWGRKRILVLSQFGSLFSWLVALAGFFVPMIALTKVDSSLFGEFTLTLPLLLLLVARALDGLTGGNDAVANAYVADISPPDQRSANFGKLTASGNLGLVLGPALAGALVTTAMGYELPVIVTAAVCFAATMLIWFNLSDEKPLAEAAEPAPACALTASTCRNHLTRTDRPATAATISVSAMLSLPRVPLLLSGSFLVYLAFSMFNIALPVYVVQTLDWSPGKMGAFFAVMSLIMVVVQGPVLKKLSKVCSDAMLVAMGGLILGCGFLLLDTTRDVTLFSAAALIAIGNGLMWPLIVASLAKRAGEHQGAVQGLAGSVAATASIIGLLAGGLLFDVFQGGLFVAASLLTFVVMLLALWAKHDEASYSDQ